MKDRIFRTVWELKKEGYSEATIDGYDRKLRLLSRLVDLQSPDDVNTVIAVKKCSNAFKEALVNVYYHYVRVNCLVWNRPLYKRQRSLPYIASSEQINQIISRASRCYAMAFSILRDTGLRPIEFYNLTMRYIDMETGVITVKSAKGGNPRTVKMKPNTLAMLKEYVGRRNFALDDRLFPDSYSMRHAFMRNRNDVAAKLHQPELRKIRLYDLRHFFATMLYHHTKDILFVKQQLGHKSLESTLVYTHLVNFCDLEFVCKVALSSGEASVLVEQGFEYVATTPEGHMLFKKLK